MKKLCSTLCVWACSLATAIVCSMVGIFLYYFLLNLGAFGAALGTGLIFLCIYAGSCIGMHLGLRLVHMQADWPGKTKLLRAVCGLLILLIGTGGQALFMLSYERGETVSAGSVDMVLLLDASGSMDDYGYSEPRTEAAVQFVESLDETTQLQLVTYGGKVISGSTTELLYMTEANKTLVTDTITAIDSTGQTNYDAALEEAIATLTGSGVRADSARAIILLTDGRAGDLSSSTVSSVGQSGAVLFTIRITSDSTTGTSMEDLIDLAEETGGFDMELTPAADGSVETADLLAAFQTAFDVATESGFVMTVGSLFSVSGGIFQNLIRLLTLLLLSLFFTVGLFGGCSRKTLLAGLTAAVVAAVLVPLLGQIFRGVMTVCLLLGAVYPSLRAEEGEILDV